MVGMASWPAWLDEGLAQYYEFGSPIRLWSGRPRRPAGRAAPPASPSGGFGRDPAQVRLSYDQSLSAVTYLLETWGDAGLQELLKAFRQGKFALGSPCRRRWGITREEFEAGWITWMGVPATPAVPPTPTATLVRPTSPSGWPTPTRKVTVSATRKATAPATPRAEATATRALAATPQPSPSPGVTPSLRQSVAHAHRIRTQWATMPAVRRSSAIPRGRSAARFSTAWWG